MLRIILLLLDLDLYSGSEEVMEISTKAASLDLSGKWFILCTVININIILNSKLGKTNFKLGTYHFQ